MEWLLVDDTGDVWDGWSAQVRRAHGFSGTASEFAAYAVKHLGFIEIKAFLSGTHILLAPRRVSPKAIAELIHWIFREAARSWVLSTFADRDGWRPRIVAHRQSLLRMLSGFAATCADPANAYLQRPVRLKGAQLGLLLSDIRARLRMTRSFDELRRLCPALVGDRYTLTRLSLSGSRLLIADVGAGYKFLDREWGGVVRGLAFQDTGDHNYGLCVADAHHKALSTDEAMVHEVDAFVKWPRRSRTRTRYRRTLLPFTSGENVRWVLSTSAPGQGIDLRATL